MNRILMRKPKEEEMCPVGYHVVRGHQRLCNSGTLTWVDAHNARIHLRNKAYWKEQGLKFPSDFDPLIVKALIAVESRFDPGSSARASTATGLMQVTNTTRRDLSGQKRWL